MIGGTGFIGPHVVRTLATGGHEIVVVVHPPAIDPRRFDYAAEDAALEGTSGAGES